MDVKYIIRTLKPINWLKGLLMLIIGLMNSRLVIGIGRFIANLIFGPLIYFLIIVSGFLLVLFIKISQKDSPRDKKNNKIIQIMTIVLYFTAYIVCLFHTILYNLSILVPILIALLGVIWLISIYYGKDWEKRSILNTVIVSLLVSFGLIYGAAVNDINIPVSLYFFFLALFSLQFSKDIIKSYKKKEGEERIDYKEFAASVGAHMTKQIAIGLNLIVIICLLIPMLTGLYNGFLYFFPMIINVILLAMACIIILKADLEKSYKKSIPFLLRTGIFLEFLAFIFASV